MVDKDLDEINRAIGALGIILAALYRLYDKHDVDLPDVASDHLKDAAIALSDAKRTTVIHAEVLSQAMDFTNLSPGEESS